MWEGRGLNKDYIQGALIGALFVLWVWEVLKPQEQFVVYDQSKVDSLIELNTLRADTVMFLLDSIAFLNYKDSVVRYRYGVHLEETQRRIDSVQYWTDEDVDRWLCENYGLCK